jgi:uncharacterized protein YkwD
LTGSNSGAQRASTPRGVAKAVLVATLATFIVAPAVLAATPAGTGATTTVTIVPTAPATWLSAEQYYLQLVNCTRTGGWVFADGTCHGYGTGRYSAYVRPLTRSVGISNHVSRPYARLLAIRSLCSHWYDGSPSFRLRRAGYLSYTWGENIGCRNGYTNVRAAILASHRNFQAEKSTNGGHWRNIKNPRYTVIGIGIWKYGTRVRLVTDFYRP